jgi:hypothetical protein
VLQVVVGVIPGDEVACGLLLPFQHLVLALTLHESEDVGLLFVPGSAAIAYDPSVLAPEVAIGYKGIVPRLAVQATNDEGVILFGPYPGGAAAVLLARAPVIGAGAVVA